MPDDSIDGDKLREAVSSVLSGFLEQVKQDQATIARLQAYQIDANLTISAIAQAINTPDADPAWMFATIRETVDCYYARRQDRKESDGDDN